MTNQTIKLMASILLLLPLVFTACVKDECTEYHTYTFYKPVYKLKSEVRSNIKANAARTVEKPGKICLYGNYIFLNDLDKGIHVIDNSNPAQPRNTAFIDIPGNLDIAIKGNVLYADMYTDLLAIDISNLAAVSVKKFVDNMFPYRSYGNGFVNSNDPQQVIVEWKRIDTTIKKDCNSYYNFAQNTRFDNLFFASSAPGIAASAPATPVGTGGSMARFTILNDRLYTVSISDLDVFNITELTNPTHVKKISLGWNIETIYPFKEKLFIGSQTGMFMFSVTNPDQPTAVGTFSHARVCDPVIAEDEYAFVTLRSGTQCQGFSNELDVLKLGTGNPSLLKVYKLTNPHGLSKDGKYLFICDGKDGLKIFDAADVLNIAMIKQIGNMETYDVIAMNKVALVVAKDGLYQFSYADPNNIKQLSKIGIQK